MLDFLANIVSLISSFIDTIFNTTTRINSIQFDNTVFTDWMGYARYAMGDPLYIMFTTTILISIGVTMWGYITKGIAAIRALLPW
jgi:hypothetical protein